MISREEHLKQINRFHDELERIDKEIELGTGDQYNLLRRYFQLTSKLWPIIDDCVDTTKIVLDMLE
tara:strand:+ start:4729 stop:4926 length:198 start_codon:yes stop_codon:yes gene_type:complete